MFFSRSSLNLGGMSARRPTATSPRTHAPTRTDRSKPRLVGGVDVGTTKVCVIIGQVDADGRINVLGVGSAPSRGLRLGVVTNINQTVDSIRKAYAQAYNLAGVHPPEVLVGIAGDHISGIHANGAVVVRNPHNGIDRRDIKKVKKQAMRLNLPEDVEKLHCFPKEYVVNGRDGITEPLGLFGQRLEARMLVVTSSVHAGNNLFRCMRRAGLQTSSVVLQSLASSLAVLTPAQRKCGVVLIDIGGGTSDIAIFHNNTLQHIGEIAMGGDIITWDVAKIFKISMHEAENLKKKFGHAVPNEVDADELLEMPRRTRGERRASRSRRELAQVIEARVEDIFLRVQAEVRRSEVTEHLSAGVVLTGGTALLEGLDTVATRMLDMPCAIAHPRGFYGMGSVVNTPIYSTSLGLMRWTVEEGRGMRRVSGPLRFLKQLVDVYGA